MVALFQATDACRVLDLPNGLVLLGDPDHAFASRLAAHYAYHHTATLLQSALVGTLSVRTRKTGDLILSGRMHKTVRRLGALAPFPPEVRARMPLLCDDEGIVAIPFGPVRDGVQKNGDLTVHFYFN